MKRREEPRTENDIAELTDGLIKRVNTMENSGLTSGGRERETFFIEFLYACSFARTICSSVVSIDRLCDTYSVRQVAHTLSDRFCYVLLMFVLLRHVVIIRHDVLSFAYGYRNVIFSLESVAWIRQTRCTESVWIPYYRLPYPACGQYGKVGFSAVKLF